MLYSLQDRLLRRELNGGLTNRTGVAGLYGDKHWVDSLDIVNELGGHHGCVNALSWSKSGRLLASGSDDTNIVIHAYQPEHSISPFSLTTSIATGHTANIFSVKFMPHSNDNIIVSAAGDSEVRIFDVEYSSRSRGRSNTTSSSAGIPFSAVGALNGVRYLSEGNTNARVYRSHSDRVKRIVTESSPHLFLTCSEDGEVRQWDLRLPSSAYPSPRGGRNLMGRRDSYDDSNVPPPLISYKRYRLDLNTISCSPSQPHYIVLGGAHLHCFLHDRRMLGRDLTEERGSPASSLSPDGDINEGMTGQATKCVRRFAPNGKDRMGSSSNGHVTACKISDASPNEMVASWSGDHIYSFDLIRSPDAMEIRSKESGVTSGEGSRVRSSKNRKRKRAQISASAEGVASRPRRLSGQEQEDIALRVRYENGQSEDIAVETSLRGSTVERVRESLLSPSQKRSLRIARSVVNIRRILFSLEGADREDENHGDSPVPVKLLHNVLEIADKILPEMDSIMRSWTYPVDPDTSEVGVHRELRKYRDAARRFVQAAAVMSKSLGGVSNANIQAQMRYDFIKSHPLEGSFTNEASVFKYDFLKAIFSWLHGGIQELSTVFRQRSGTSSISERFKGPRFPVPENASTEDAVHDYLVSYLSGLAGSDPVPNVDTSRFEVDENRYIFPTEVAAVNAFANAIKIPLLTGNSDQPFLDARSSASDEAASSSEIARGQELRVARRFWGFKVARGLLMNAAEGVDFFHVDQGFGGLGQRPDSDSERDQSEIDPDEEDPVVDSVRVTRPRVHSGESAEQPSRALVENDQTDSVSDIGSGSEVNVLSILENLVQGGDDSDESNGDDNGDDENEDEDNGNDNDNDDDNSRFVDDEDIHIEHSQLLFRSSSERARLRASVEAQVPVNSHTRTYQGHCNVKTVKDVNFYGLNDEYVVSGSDSGHLFIWEKSSQKLVNILQGDGEVVNVIQGHPYEPMLAVSGIDHTVKIFSPDARSQREAKLGINVGVSAHRSSGYSTLNRPHWSRHTHAEEDEYATYSNAGRSGSASAEPLLPGRSLSPPSPTPPGDDVVRSKDEEIEDDDSDLLEGLKAAESGGLSSRKRMEFMYQITAQNDVKRQSGREAVITRGMLAQLAQHMRMRRMTADDDGEGGEGGIIISDDDCMVM